MDYFRNQSRCQAARFRLTLVSVSNRNPCTSGAEARICRVILTATIALTFIPRLTSTSRSRYTCNIGPGDSRAHCGALRSTGNYSGACFLSRVTNDSKKAMCSYLSSSGVPHVHPWNPHSSKSSRSPPVWEVRVAFAHVGLSTFFSVLRSASFFSRPSEVLLAASLARRFCFAHPASLQFSTPFLLAHPSAVTCPFFLMHYHARSCVCACVATGKEHALARCGDVGCPSGELHQAGGVERRTAVGHRESAVSYYQPGKALHCLLPCVMVSSRVVMATSAGDECGLREDFVLEDAPGCRLLSARSCHSANFD